ncbi:MAG: cell filamentation protein Fic, partial [Bacteroidaceae bacterium]
IELFRNFMFDEHIRNLEQTIRNYQASIEDDGLEPCVDVGINEQRVLELIQINNRITAKEVAESLSVSLRQGERIMATLTQL